MWEARHLPPTGVLVGPGVRTLQPCNVSRLSVALNDSASALSALVPTAPIDRVTPSLVQSWAKAFALYWAP
jgi:hypothetical protein